MPNVSRSLPWNRVSLRAALSMMTVAVLAHAAASAVDPSGLGATLTGLDRYKKIMVSRTSRGKLKKKVISRGADPVAPSVTFGTGASESGPFTISSYESFPVQGTWTVAPHDHLTLAVDADAFAAQKGPELCPASSCTPTATWTPRSAKVNPRTNVLSVKWRVTVRQANADGTYVEETFAFKGAGPLLHP